MCHSVHKGCGIPASSDVCLQGGLHPGETGSYIVPDRTHSLSLTSECPVSVERIVLDLESEAAYVLFPLGVTFCHWIFFISYSKDENANIGMSVRM